MHIVHKNSKYGTVEEAREFEDGLSVIGAFFKVEKVNGLLSSIVFVLINFGSHFHYLKTITNIFYPGLNTIFNTVPFVIRFNSTASTLQLITLGSLLPNINREKFYTYQGSLTTPPCSEAVTWVVYPEVIPISVFHVRN